MNELKEFLLALVEHTRTGKHTKFSQLRFFSDYIGGRITYRATKKVIRMLEKAANTLFKNYCKDVPHQQANINTLLAYKQLLHAANYYKEEQALLKDVLADYEDWLFDGNFLLAVVFGEEKPD